MGGSTRDVNRTQNLQELGDRDISVKAWVSRVWQIKSHLPRDRERWYRTWATWQEAECQAGPGKQSSKRYGKGYTGEWVIIKALGTDCNLNSLFKRLKLNWFKHRLQSTKPQRNSAWCSANRHNYPSLGANREIKTENIVQAYPVDVDNFNYN